MSRIALFDNAAWNLTNYRRDLIRGLTNHGYQLQFIVPQATEALRKYGEVLPLKMSPSGMQPQREWQVVNELQALLKSNPPSALLSFTIKPNIYGSWVARKLNIPMIATVTGLGEAFGGSLIKRLIAQTLYRQSVARTNLVFAQNEEDRRFLLEHRLAPAHATQLVPGSGINTTYFAPLHELPPRDAPAPTTSLRFVFIGRLREDKGFFEYAEAARQLKQEGIAAEFVVVGKLENDRKLSVNPETVASLISDGTIEHQGFVEDIRDVIDQADCIVLPSYREGLSRSLLEGASMSRPLIASDVPGCRELIRPEVNGYLCSVRDAASLADAMRRFSQLSEAERLAMGQASRQLAVSTYDVSQVIKMYVEALQSLNVAGR